MANKTTIKTRQKGSGTVYKEGKRWYLKVTVAGSRKTTMLRDTKGIPCTTEQEAKKSADRFSAILLADSKEEIALHVAEAKKLRKKSGLLLSDAWKTFIAHPNRPDSSESTLKNHYGIFRLFLSWLSKNRPEFTRVAEVDIDTAEAYFTYVWKTGVSAKRYNDIFLTLRLVYRHLLKPAGMDANPFDSIVKKPLEIVSRKEFTQEQVRKIIDGFDTGFFTEVKVNRLASGGIRDIKTEHYEYKPMNREEMRILLLLCCYTGCRGQDGCLMTWEEIDLDRNVIHYIPRKTARKTNRRAVTLPIHPELREALANATISQIGGKTGYVLPKVAERYKRNATGIQKDVMKIIHYATGLETTNHDTHSRRKMSANAYGLHSFRHTFVSFCANAGVPLAVVSEIVGHGNPAMTRHYSHISIESKQTAISSLPQLSHPIEKRMICLPHPTVEREREELHQWVKTLSMDEVKEFLTNIKQEVK